MAVLLLSCPPSFIPSTRHNRSSRSVTSSFTSPFSAISSGYAFFSVSAVLVFFDDSFCPCSSTVSFFTASPGFCNSLSPRKAAAPIMAMQAATPARIIHFLGVLPSAGRPAETPISAKDVSFATSGIPTSTPDVSALSTLLPQYGQNLLLLSISFPHCTQNIPTSPVYIFLRPFSNHSCTPPASKTDDF